MLKQLLILLGLILIALLPLACGNNNSSPSAPVTVYYVPVTPTPSGPHPYLAQWGSYGPSNGQFYQPFDLAVNSAGTTVWVSDAQNYRVQYFTGAGAYLGQWGSYGVTNGLFNYPTGIAVDSTGTTVYVADTDNNRIQYFSGTGTYLGQWGASGSGDGNFNFPRGICLNSAGTTIYVADGNSNNRIQYFDGIGSYLGQWPTTFCCPWGVAVNAAGTTVYVSEAGDSIIVSNGTGSPYGIGFFGSTGSGDGNFNGPHFFARDIGNNIYVADSNNNRIVKVGYDGGYMDQLDGSSSGVAFNQPYGVAVDFSGNVYVADTFRARIVKFGP